MFHTPAHKQTSSPTPFLKPEPPPSGTHIIAVLDRSGSMAKRTAEVIEGFNAFVDEQKRIDGPAFMSLVLFNETIQRPFIRQPLERFNALDRTNYVANGGTALLDAIGAAISNAWNKDDRVIMVIQTDGEENSSRTFDLQRLKALIEQKQAEGWTFVFLGSNIDSFAQASSMGINLATVANYSDKLEGQTRSLYSNASASIGMLRSGASGQAVSSTLRSGLVGNDGVPDAS
jgi:uncharacterized protein YegL